MYRRIRLISDWEAGRLMPLGQVMRDGSGGYWKVTGRNFEREGFPYVIYELLEAE